MLMNPGALGWGVVETRSAHQWLLQPCFCFRQYVLLLWVPPASALPVTWQRAAEPNYSEACSRECGDRAEFCWSPEEFTRFNWKLSTSTGFTTKLQKVYAVGYIITSMNKMIELCSILLCLLHKNNNNNLGNVFMKFIYNDKSKGKCRTTAVPTS